VFFSADVARMEELEGASLVSRSDRHEVLSNVLVAIVPKDAKREPKTAHDLVGLKHLALANPASVPAGVYAKKYLESVGLWQQVEPAVVPTLDVRAALAAVEAGHAEAGMVYRTDALISRGVRIAFEVPRAEGPPIVYALAPLRHGKEGARALVDYLVSPEALAVYERYGFLVIERK
jgi:molybdate transport system substrate-binding protein